MQKLSTKEKLLLISWIYIFSAIWGIMESENFLWLTFNGVQNQYDFSYHLLMIILAFFILIFLPILTRQKLDLLFVLGGIFLWSLIEDLSFLLHRVFFYDMDIYNIGFSYVIGNSGIYDFPIFYFTHSIISLLTFIIWLKRK